MSSNCIITVNPDKVVHSSLHRGYISEGTRYKHNYKKPRSFKNNNKKKETSDVKVNIESLHTQSIYMALIQQNYLSEVGCSDIKFKRIKFFGGWFLFLENFHFQIPVLKVNPPRFPHQANDIIP